MNVCTNLPWRVDRVSEMKRKQLIGIDTRERLFVVAVYSQKDAFSSVLPQYSLTKNV